MNDNYPRRFLDDEPEWVWDIAKKHNIALRAECNVGFAYVLCADARGLLQEISDPAAREWSTFRIARQLQMAIEMLTDAERLVSMPL